MELHIPKKPDGSYFPALPVPRRPSERALLAVIKQALMGAFHTARGRPRICYVRALVKDQGCDGTSKSVLSLPEGVKFPVSARKWARLWSLNPLQQLDKEKRRRTYLH